MRSGQAGARTDSGCKRPARSRWPGTRVTAARGDLDTALLERLPERVHGARVNSGSSSRKSTPRWASVISPGMGRVPPPTSPCAEIVWCGARNGRSVASRPLPMPAALCTCVISRALRSSALAGCPAACAPAWSCRPRRPDHEQVVAAGGGDLERSLRVTLAADVGQVWRLRSRFARIRHGRHGGFRPPAPVEKVREPRERRDGAPLDALDEGGLRSVRLGHERAVARSPGTERGVQRSSHRTQLAAERQLPRKRAVLERLRRKLAVRDQ